ncbi:response regulator [Salegentibacter mishustinae]|uniref:Response regulator receiver protein n=1 Tax=Salegentibacter mishustinae TaxID=270918 RepID=A0A0Q9ZAT5_9FLAO|nr:response regulator [Salegentibacter mishustinae]KRG30085.1 response regulator receiver protein [Salegentibacter mishustinae]MDX1428131.1 response regulator [Salegentibacter mishustinae]MDX1719391.1 response regulator [Salegentibacter mishustinae]PNW19533.1 response regulator receiver protein [Salegentibacter mishustinae]PZX62012.1 response regulator receiver domain-containing protein [Salegentibacter mishustinae]|tara:strand:- start:1226 stop:1594 length:369 start_codon:yes stop_codon:yes gene_type:complete
MSTIILVDDQPIANFITRKLLEIEGYNEDVIDFTNPEEALVYLEDKQNTLIFLDLNMPEMNGWEFLDYLKSKSQEHRIIILTSSTSTIDQNRAKEYDSVIKYVEKPLNKDKFKKLQPFLQQQ